MNEKLMAMRELAQAVKQLNGSIVKAGKLGISVELKIDPDTRTVISDISLGETI